MASASLQVYQAKSLPSISIKTPSNETSDQDDFIRSFLSSHKFENKARPRSFSIASSRHLTDLPRRQLPLTCNSISTSLPQDPDAIMNSAQSLSSTLRPITIHSHDSTCPGLPINLRNDTNLLKKYQLVPTHLHALYDEAETQVDTPKSNIIDPTELVYNITTSKFRHARRSTMFPDSAPSSPRLAFLTRPPGTNKLMKKQKNFLIPRAPDPSFMDIDLRMPPLLVDGRRSVLFFPKKVRTIEVYWRHGLNIRTATIGPGKAKKNQRGHLGETAVQLRKVQLPPKIWFGRNFLGWWDELWVERA